MICGAIAPFEAQVHFVTSFWLCNNLVFVILAMKSSDLTLACALRNLSLSFKSRGTSRQSRDRVSFDAVSE